MAHSHDLGSVDMVGLIQRIEEEMRNISFALTTRQFRDRSKDVTRRLGWSKLKPGEKLQACVKCMGRKKGEPLERLGVIEIISNTPERLDAMEESDCAREGFPEMTAGEFVAMFCEHQGVQPDQIINRIEFRYVD